MNRYHLAFAIACLAAAGATSAKSWPIHVPIDVQSDLYLDGTCYDKFGQQSERAVRNTERCDFALVNGTTRTIKDWVLKITWTGADPDGNEQAARQFTPYGTRVDPGQEYALGDLGMLFVWPGTEGRIRARFTRLVFK